MKVGLIGGQSRSALALTRYARRADPELEFVAFTRRQPAVHDATETRVMPGYDAIAADDLSGCDVVINFVGATRAADRAEFSRINAQIPAALARAAKQARARHFIHLSSLSIHGPARWIGPSTPIAPTTDYGRSKAEAEARLREIAEPGFPVTLVRIPTVYGPSGRSKIGSLAAALRRLPAFPVPPALPRRSVISHDNLARVLLELVADARDGVVYAADPEPFDLATLTAILPAGPRLLTVPSRTFAPLKALAPSLYQSLYETMEIDPALLLEPDRHPLRTTRLSLADAFARATADR